MARGHRPLSRRPLPRRRRLHDAGAIRYYSDWTTLDYIGLNDEAIAHGADPTTAVVDYHATVIILRSTVPAPPGTAFGVHGG